MSRDIAFELDSATLMRADGSTVCRDLSWRIREGETWALVGPAGAGKSSLAEGVRGRLRLASGSIAWPFLDRLRAGGRSVGFPSEAIQILSFKEESRLFSYGRHYYQQRYNFIEKEDDLTLEAFLRTGSPPDAVSIRAAAAQLGIEGLLPQSFIKLSNGQTRRARIAKALLGRAELLILDEPFMGLDPQGRSEVGELLGRLVGRGTRLLLIARPEAVPGWVTHVLDLDNGVREWTRDEFSQRSTTLPPAAPTAPATREIEPAAIVELRNVQVAYDDKPILRDVTWTVRTGERWALSGPNGSGKSTLLSLLCGDHPQAYRNSIRLFGRQRGSGESIWEIKRRIGFLSPEMHLYFSEPLTAARTVATGFHDVLAYRPIAPEQTEAVAALFRAFGVEALAERPFGRLSTGEQRLVLLLRALVKRPPLLILDEPFQGLDGAAVERAKNWLDDSLTPEQTLIFVSHYEEEIPRTVRNRLTLRDGVITGSSS